MFDSLPAALGRKRRWRIKLEDSFISGKYPPPITLIHRGEKIWEKKR
jgi:hypothetical protein